MFNHQDRLAYDLFEEDADRYPVVYTGNEPQILDEADHVGADDEAWGLIHRI